MLKPMKMESQEAKDQHGDFLKRKAVLQTQVPQVKKQLIGGKKVLGLKGWLAKLVGSHKDGSGREIRPTPGVECRVLAIHG